MIIEDSVNPHLQEGRLVAYRKREWRMVRATCKVDKLLRQYGAGLQARA